MEMMFAKEDDKGSKAKIGVTKGSLGAQGVGIYPGWVTSGAGTGVLPRTKGPVAPQIQP